MRVVALIVVVGALLSADAVNLRGATVESPNFRVHASTNDVAKQVADAAEKWRKSLAATWFGHRLPRWAQRCEVHVNLGKDLGAGGATKFKFSQGHVYGWKMNVQGSLERVLDSVIPHEVNHTILACYFRRPVPRWADEGAATLVEHESEKRRQLDLVDRLVNRGGRIPLRSLLAIKQYPNDPNQVMALYAEGFSLTEFLIQQGGHKQFLLFLNDAHHRGWDAAVKAYYRKANVESLERAWLGWVMAGDARLTEGNLIADHNSKVNRNPSQTRGSTLGDHKGDIVRSQSPDRLNDSTKNSSTPVHLSPIRSNQTGRFEAVSAPDPRRSNTDTSVIREVSLPRTDPKATQELRPLGLVRINKAGHSVPKNSTASQPLSPRQPRLVYQKNLHHKNKEHHNLRSLQNDRPDLAPPVVSEKAAFGRRLRETNLHRDAARREPRFLNWSRFPTQR